MPNIENFDKRNLELLKQEMDLAMQKIGERHGIKTSIGKVKYNTGNCTIQIHAALINGPTITLKDTLEQELRASGYRYGLYGEDLGKTFLVGFNEYTFAGLKPKSRKTPIIGMGADGKYYRFGVDILLQLRKTSKVVTP